MVRPGSTRVPEPSESCCQVERFELEFNNYIWNGEQHSYSEETEQDHYPSDMQLNSWWMNGNYVAYLGRTNPDLELDDMRLRFV